MKSLIAKLKEYVSHPVLSRHRAFLTICTLNVAVYVACLLNANLMEELALKHADWVGVPTVHGLLNLITSMFDHGNFPHIFYNLLIVMPFAAYLEWKVGSVSFWKYWLWSGIGGSALFMLTPSIAGWAGALGASGACFGIMAAAVVHVDEHPILRALALFVLGCLLLPQYQMTVIGFLFPGAVASAAHVGGAVTGLLLSALEKKAA